MRKPHIHSSSTHLTCAREQLYVCTHRDVRNAASLNNTACRRANWCDECRDIKGPIRSKKSDMKYQPLRDVKKIQFVNTTWVLIDI